MSSDLHAARPMLAGMEGPDAVHIDASMALSAGQATAAGVKDVNEDSMGVFVPEGPLLTLKGAAAVIADGVSSAESGREAAETCVQNFLTDYFSTPESWTVKTSAQVVLTAQNRWLYAQGHSALEAHRGYVCTLSIVVIKSRTAHLFHIGDTRIYRLRDGLLEQLTTDHATEITETQTYLSRAMGMDVKLQVDYKTIDVRDGDVFFTSTDGVHDTLPRERIEANICDGIERGRSLEEVCKGLVAASLEAGTQDNVTCQLIRIDALADETADDIHRRLTELPFPPPLAPGMKLDGYEVEKEIHASSRSQLYLVREDSTGRQLVMKTPSVNYDEDPAYIERFVMEPWIGRRIENAHVAEVVEPHRPPTFLYYLMESIDGGTLEDWIRAHPKPPIADALAILDQIVDGLRAFHRRETWHQDLRPANVMIDTDGSIRIVDFGSCWVSGIHEIAVPLERDFALGTAAYSAPETRSGRSEGTPSDLFSLGTIAYEMLTGHLPYGAQTEQAVSIADFERLEYTPSYHHNPMVPVWMDGALRKALQPRPSRRYRLLSEFMYDLHHPNAAFAGDTRLPLVERDPIRFWKGLAALLAAGWALTVWWLVR